MLIHRARSSTPRGRRTFTRHTLIGAGVTLALLATGTTAPASGLSVSTTWGVAGGYPTTSAYSDIRETGATTALVDMTWAAAQPTATTWDEAYFARVAQQIREMRAAGLGVVLEPGVYAAPAWALARPGMRYVDQNGRVYQATPEPNLVWNTAGRFLAKAYFVKIFQELGTDFVAVRAGGGHWNELTYPREYRADGSVTNSYWAFDANAAASNPVPGWKPGQASPSGQAGKFLDWYLQSLAKYQNWQIAALRNAGYARTVAVLYPSWGLRPGDTAKALATDLAGTSPIERNGDIASGVDHTRQVTSLVDSNVALWCTWADATTTWADNPSPVAELGALAARAGRQLMGENTGDQTSPAALGRLVSNARNYRMSLVMWIRYETMGRPGSADAGDLFTAVRQTAA